ncbi:MAG: TIGR03084 family protein [Acetobacteraceae bacterium]|nr:TIGR03084 family protein [Acetobacteraceae bacterium]
MEIQQITDLRGEADELDRLLVTLAPADWDRPTLFKQWTINDVVLHLHMADVMAFNSVTDPDGYDLLMNDIAAQRAKGLSRVAETRQRFSHLSGEGLRAHWKNYLVNLCDALAKRDPQDRLKWPGPGMGVRMFTTARQMETWAHAQAVYDLLGVDRPPASPRLRNIAEIGARTFSWAYRNRGLDVPADAPYIRLTTPSGDVWEWNTPSDTNAVTGNALSFCQATTQIRNAVDTNLTITGATARHWMSIVQCFAGPPETPPAPGSRHKSVA